MSNEDNSLMTEFLGDQRDITLIEIESLGANREIYVYSDGIEKKTSLVCSFLREKINITDINEDWSTVVRDATSLYTSYDVCGAFAYLLKYLSYIKSRYGEDEFIKKLLRIREIETQSIGFNSSVPIAPFRIFNRAFSIKGMLDCVQSVSSGVSFLQASRNYILAEKGEEIFSSIFRLCNSARGVFAYMRSVGMEDQDDKFIKIIDNFITLSREFDPSDKIRSFISTNLIDCNLRKPDIALNITCAYMSYINEGKVKENRKGVIDAIDNAFNAVNSCVELIALSRIDR